MNVHCDILHTLYTFIHKPKCKLRNIGQCLIEISSDIEKFLQYNKFQIQTMIFFICKIEQGKVSRQVSFQHHFHYRNRSSQPYARWERNQLNPQKK